MVSLSLARAVTSRARGRCPARSPRPRTGVTATAGASARSDGTLAIRSIRRTLAPFPGPWSGSAALAAAGSASSAAAPGTAPTANTEGVVNTHRGIAL